MINNDTDTRDSVAETSESEMSEGEGRSSGEGGSYHRRRMETLIQKDALHNISLIARRITEKEVAAFWFVLLPGKSYSLLSGFGTELVN